MKYVLAFLALLAAAPLASACEGLSPGDEIAVGDARCSLAFLLADRTGLYFATAGHCIQEGETASSPGVGPIGTGVLHYLVPETGSETDGSPGEDFGLILIDPSVYDRLNPKMCGWDGPTGIYDETPGSGGVKHYGHGLLFGDLGPATQQRQGFNLQNDNTAFYWTGAGVPGDSGSGVLADDGRALGVLTHLQFGATSDTNGGTHLHRGFQLAKDMKGLDLRLVLAGEDPLQVLQQARGAPPANATTNATGAPGNATTSPTPRPTPTTPPPTTGTGQTATPPSRDDEGLVPAAQGDDGQKATPGIGLAALLVTIALVAHRRR